jgi:hypothetical protein
VTFLCRPDLQTISIITPLLKSNKADAQFYLSISAIVHSYCKWDSNCATHAEVANIISWLETQAYSGCKFKERDQATIDKVRQIFLHFRNLAETCLYSIWDEQMSWDYKFRIINFSHAFFFRFDSLFDTFLEVIKI